MKKMKKLFAILMTMAMVMGLGITGFAETIGEATITITNAGNGKFLAVKVIEEDNSKDTGWDFVDGYAQYFTDSNAFNTEDTQAIIKGMIASINPDADEADSIENFDQKYAYALQNVYTNMQGTPSESSPLDVTSAGLYVIKGTESGYSYSPMAAYVGIDYESGKPSGILSATVVNAKKAPTTIQKTNNDEDNIIETERDVVYTIQGTVPFIPTTDQSRFYQVIDTITGAQYKEKTTNIVEVKVEVGTGDEKFEETYDVPFSTLGTSQTFTLDLTNDLLKDNDVNTNKYANQTIKITYTATVKDTTVNNTVNVGNGSQYDEDKYGSSTDKLIGGEVTLTKKNDEQQTLADAEFVLVKKIANEVAEGEEQTYTLKYATVDNNNMLTGWVDNEENATTLKTNSSGTITVKGLDSKATYEFKETKAPEGYSINEMNAVINWGTPDSNLSTPVQGTSTMVDSELAALPETGGMGTTLFTIAGCVIMISAAGLFFATRKKAN